MGPIYFDREYMCKPIDDSSSLFPIRLLETAYDENLTFAPFGKVSERYFVGSDFARSAEVGADYSVFIVVEQKEEKKIIKKIE